MSDINQDDIDKLLQDALMGEGDDSPAQDVPPPEVSLPDLEGAASQDDIDALFAAVGAGEPVPAPAPAAVPEPAPPAKTDEGGAANQDDIDALFAAVGDAGGETAEPEAGGVANQDDIDALFASVGGDAPEPAAAGPGQPAEPEAGGVANQDDIDALFSAVDNAPEPEPERGQVDQDDINALFESELAEAEAVVDKEAAAADSDLNELLSSIAGEEPAGEDAPFVPTDDTETAMPEEAERSEPAADDIDMDELLRQVAEAAPPPPPPPPKTPMLDAGDTTVLSPDVSTALAQAQAEAMQHHAPPAAMPPPAPPVPPPQVPAAPPPPSAAAIAPSGQRREFSVLYGAGEVESVANQINALLNTMSEKAHGYMQAWISADSEAKELRSRALEEERRRTTLESERGALSRQLDELRLRLGELEGGKIAEEESRRTLETTHKAKIRELESQVSLLSSEAETLKNELTRVRNQATGVDIESRRARFEVDRLKNEVESERMERLRIQRALENREKEIQAMQSQSQGQASSLFIDELHRLVRRLESELDARSAGAHEALKQLDRLETTEAMVPVAANLRASLMQALGQDGDAADALKSLGREAAGIKGPAAVAPGKAEMVSFESALSTYNLTGAVEVAGSLLRDASATPGTLMRKIYQCPALRRPEVGDYLVDLARLLEGLRTVQESNDRTRGSETGESEVFYVHMFDFLHNLVCLKLINRLSGDIWRLFLDLRGRFSFVTSDKQWAEYRDKTLKS